MMRNARKKTFESLVRQKVRSKSLLESLRLRQDFPRSCFKTLAGVLSRCFLFHFVDTMGFWFGQVFFFGI